MKNKFLLLLFTFFSLNSLAQIRYQKGYFIDNDGKKIDCFIRNVDWKDNPKYFDYKLTENGEKLTARTTTVKEFSVENESIYKCFITEWDVSSNTVNDISDERQPYMKKDTIFLRQLVEGKANLYLFEKGDMKRYFFTVDTMATPQQLIYKRYKTTNKASGRSYIVKNNAYIAQLQQFIRCKDASITSFSNIKYTKNDMVKAFDKYNKCNDTSKIKPTIMPIVARKVMDVSVKAGLYQSTAKITDNSGSVTDLGKQVAPRLGFEFQYYLPFNKNKWAIVVEPTFSYFTGKKTIKKDYYYYQNTKLKYQFLSVALGVRHHFFINKNNTIFVNAFWIWNKPIDNSNIKIVYSNYSYDLQTTTPLNNSNNIAIGLGYRYKRASIEGRYLASRDIIKDSGIAAQYKSLGVTLGYTLFSK